MKVQHIMAGSVLLILTGCQSMGMGGGETKPTVTRSGMVKDVIISDSMTPATLTVNPGDEIRWINRRQGPARVVFLEPVSEMLSCERNFGGMMGPDKKQYTANLNANDSASVCFRNPGQLKYVVRADSSEPTGEISIPGTIQVTGASDQMSKEQLATETAPSSMQQDRGTPSRP